MTQTYRSAFHACALLIALGWLGCGDSHGADDAGIDAARDADTDGGADAFVPACEVDGDCSPYENARAVCADGRCEPGGCTRGFADCDGSPGCELPITTAENCGGCGVACAGGTPVCDTTLFVPACASGCGSAERCGDACVDLTTDPMHCGRCGNACPTPDGALAASCDGSACGFSCDAGREDCDADAANGCEVNSNTDILHCGGCGMACTLAPNAASMACVSGGCGVASCDAGFADCDGDPTNGCEVDLRTTATHCGACGRTCEPDVACVDSVCSDPFAEVAVAESHVCAIRDSGAVACWGMNERREVSAPLYPMLVEAPTRLLDGTADSAPTVRARSVAVGTNHTCYVDLSGTLHCLGGNAENELGDGSARGTVRVGPVAVASDDASFAARTFASVYSYHRHSCALDDMGDLWCWGLNSRSQCGRAGAASKAARVALPAAVAGETVQQVALSYQSSCALLSNGEVYCWGDNAYAQLGLGTTTPSSTATPMPVVDTSGSGTLSGVTDLYAGRSEYCARLSDRTLVCWGWNLNYTITSTSGSVSVPTPVASDVGEAFPHIFGVCWSDSTGTAYCRGRRNEGQFGSAPDASAARVATRAPELDGRSRVRAHYYTSCGFKADGLYCAGASFSGTIPRTSLVEETPAEALDMGGSPVTGMSSLSVSRYGSCGVRAGVAQCWGFGGSNNQGNGTNISSPSPTPVLDIADVIAVARGNIAACAISTTTGTNALWCWGLDRRGAMGGIGSSSRPRALPAIPSPIALSMADDHGCAISAPSGAMGTVYCWGDNESLQSGQARPGGINATVTPSVVRMNGDGAVIADAVSVATGEDFSCAIRSGGQLVCWGANGAGQLGIGTTSAAELASNAMLDNAVAVELGSLHGCAIDAASAVRCWGDNTNGQLGTGDMVSSSVPVATSFGGSAVSVAAGLRFSCAAYTDGSVRCWGDNYTHQLGDGSLARALSPQLVPGLTDVVSVANGSFRGDSTCAARADGSFACWGPNEFGSLSSDPALYLGATRVDATL